MGEEIPLIGVGRVEAGAERPGAGEAVIQEAVRVGGVAVDILSA